MAARSINASFSGSHPDHYASMFVLLVHLMSVNCVSDMNVMCNSWENKLFLLLHWKSQHGSNILSTHIPSIPCQSAISLLRYNFFKIWPWKSKVKVMGDVDIESHNMGATFYRLTSLWFHVNRPSHSWDTTFSKSDLENPRSRSWLSQSWKSQSGCNILSTHIPFAPCQSALPFLRYSIFKIWPWKSKVKVMGDVEI